ncbi:hypothetical protein MWU59_06780 [Flavobacteriaceae bacterium F08102]|nr:hypothetical protein [Flavobacteriaceae bacterium F08102]
MLSIIVLSSDGYADCWYPFFYSLKKYFPLKNEYEIILSTNEKKYTHEGLEIKTINSGLTTPWSKRLKNCVQQAKYDLLFVLTEDFFIRSPLNVTMFEGFLNLLKEKSDVHHIRLLSTYDRTASIPSEYPHLDLIDPKTKLRFLYLPGLWKRNVLAKYLFNYESVFMSEKIGDIRSTIYKDNFYAISRSYYKEHGQFYDCTPSGALFKGKWSKEWIVPFFKRENIDIDLSLRGFATLDFQKSTRLKNKIQLIKHPISTIRSFSSLLWLKIKGILGLIK